MYMLMCVPINTLSFVCATEGPGSILLGDVPRRLAGVQRGLDPLEDVQEWWDGVVMYEKHSMYAFARS